MKTNFLNLCIFMSFISLPLMFTSCTRQTQVINEPVTTELFLYDEGNVFASAEFVPSVQAQLSFPNGGQHIQVLVTPGQRVEVGDLLATSETSQLTALVAQAQANFHRAEYALAVLKASPDEQSLAAAEAALKNAEANYDRLERAGAREIELEAAESQVEAAQVTLEALKDGPSEEQLLSAQSDLLSAQAQLDQQLLALNNASMYAPFTGTVIEIYVNDHENANPNQPIFLLADERSMRLVTTDLSEGDAVRLGIGDRAVINIDALPDLKLDGEIVNIARISQPGSGVYFQVTLAVVDIPEKIAWGMSAFVEFLPD